MLELGDMALELDVATLFDSIETVGDFTSGGDSGSSDAGDGGVVAVGTDQKGQSAPA